VKAVPEFVGVPLAAVTIIAAAVALVALLIGTVSSGSKSPTG